ncbi:MAG: menaquinone biosynthesis protein [Deltaproteobacteria bacterium]|nr:menaquinone biosynthesis protein [Deltaproteobacteria bacterium]
MLYSLGAVPYLNALPLIHYLSEKPRLEAPAALARLLRIGQIDIATAPIVTYFENPYTLVPGICIGSNGPVKSVKLFFTKTGINIQNVQSIYLDMESRTSILLLKVLLQFKYGRRLDEITFYHPLPPRDCEAKLLIGDKTMKEISENPSLDLGEEWTQWTGKPFVYAAWLSRLPEVSEKAIQELTLARDQGCNNIPSVIPMNPPLPTAAIQDYLKKNLIFRLGSAEREGMELFRDYLLRAELLQSKSAA